MKEELIKYLTKLVELQEKTHGLKGNREDLETFLSLLRIDVFTMIDPKNLYGKSVADFKKYSNLMRNL